MTRGGFATGEGLTIRVYEVLADGTPRDLKPAAHTYGSRPIPAPPRRYGDSEPGAELYPADGSSSARGAIASGS